LKSSSLYALSLNEPARFTKIFFLQVIRELDEKKKIELRAAWDKVNKDFGSIFSTLLPGTNAKLTPPGVMSIFF
jgi:hypothetical protein